ncbi:metal-dependent hydrolase [Pseudoduganella violaceinigra]|uniref:metal-dependent hydrolase n=1 Tax=Pseudoduganella violaceinigra TaxID=246602 RepID=UPI00041F5233|nr:metal-dependent hydrolase [Pseudoduganella violaceinigra]
MDNITHSVVGLGVGELIQRSLPPEAEPARQTTRHRLLLTACALASNFPDLDLLFTGLAPAPLGYLLHHRGHTHTLLFLLPQALLLLALLWALWPNARALLRASRHARRGLGVALAAGFLLHLGMDFMNNYGVHPFHPFSGTWYFGDMVYIIEPVFWVAFGVPLAMAVPSRRGRIVLLAVLPVVLLYVTLHGYLGWTSFEALVTLGAAVALLRFMHMQSRRALLLAVGVALAYVGVQASASFKAREAVTAALVLQDPQARVLDVALTAFPSQPLCWSFTSIESDGKIYQLRRGHLSLAPALLAPRECPPALSEDAAGEMPVVVPGVLLSGSWQGSVADLRERAASDCRLAAWLRFARMPAMELEQASDLRFATTPRGNFTTLKLAARPQCPFSVPQWGMPRADLLGEGPGRD